MTSRRRAGVAKGQERHLRRSLLLAFIFVAIGFDGTALGQSSDGLDIAANGKLRAGMIAIRVLGGVAEPVGKFISTKLGVLYEPILYPNPEAYAQSVGKGEWDIAIGPRVLASADRPT